MIRTIAISSIFSAVVLFGLSGCTPGGIGDPCTPEDEYNDTFSGYSVDEVNVESRSFQCETRICLVNHFQGRVSCPYGNAESTVNTGAPNADQLKCFIPGDGTRPIKGAVDPQLTKRQANDAVYCSCRCSGPDKNARYCDCPSGFQCTELVDKLGLDGGQLAGGYCIRESTQYVKGSVDTSLTCDRTTESCGKVDNLNQPL